MIQKRKVRGKEQVKVTFVLPEEDVSGRVSVVGDFNDWDPAANRLVRRSNNTYSAALTLDAGKRYAFRYICDGNNWMNDKAADAYEPNEFGSQNCIVIT